jgi:hypothetical protein
MARLDKEADNISVNGSLQPLQGDADSLEGMLLRARWTLLSTDSLTRVGSRVIEGSKLSLTVMSDLLSCERSSGP